MKINFRRDICLILSLMPRRYAKVGFIPNLQAEDFEVSNYELELPNRRVQMASWLKSALENSNFAKQILLFATMLGTSMLIGDDILTPCISGLQLLFTKILFLDHYYL